METPNEFWEFEVKPEAFSGTRNHVAKLILDGTAAGIVFDRPVLNNAVIGTPYHPVEKTFDGGLPGTQRNHEGADELDTAFASLATVEGTTGSARGRDFYSPEFDNSTEDDVEVLYRNQVGTFGDLFTRVEITFLDGYGASSFNFGIDTDRVTGLTAIPEPSSIAVCGIVSALLIGVPMYRRRRRATAN